MLEGLQGAWEPLMALVTWFFSDACSAVSYITRLRPQPHLSRRTKESLGGYNEWFVKFLTDLTWSFQLRGRGSAHRADWWGSLGHWKRRAGPKPWAIGWGVISLPTWMEWPLNPCAPFTDPSSLSYMRWSRILVGRWGWKSMPGEPQSRNLLHSFWQWGSYLIHIPIHICSS